MEEKREDETVKAAGYRSLGQTSIASDHLGGGREGSALDVRVCVGEKLRMCATGSVCRSHH